MHAQKAILSTLAFLAVWGAMGFCVAAGVSTRDGLTVRLDDATGAVKAVLIDGKPLPMLPGVHGGISCRELRPIRRHEPKVLASADFEKDGGWRKMAQANWQEGKSVAAVRMTDGGADGSQGYVRLGDKAQYGHGVGFSERIAVEPSALYEISWAARVPAVSATYILYLRLFDAEGRDITAKAKPLTKWRYSPYSKTHYQSVIAVKEANTWQRLCLAYIVPEGVASLEVSLCLWRGDYVDADCLTVCDVGRGGWQKPMQTGGQVTPSADGTAFVQRVPMPQHALAFELTFTPKADHIRVEGEVRETHEPIRDRAIEVSYALPMDATGWWWHDDVRTRRRVEGADAFDNTFACVGHSVSYYPLSCISSDGVGVAVGVPMDRPRIERREYSVRDGFRTVFDLGLSPLTKKVGPGRATFAFVIYRADPQWGFRSALARYYAMFPQFFEKHTAREGCWLFPVRPSEIPHPEDFGLTFWEGYSKKAEERDCARRHGIYILPYTEVWGIRQHLPDVKEKEDAPPYEELYATLKGWAEDRTSEAKWGWLGGLRWQTAQAILNSLPRQADGTAPYTLDKYGTWACWWKTNPDPDLPQPNRWELCKAQRIDIALPNADGIYLDSVTLWSMGYENYREEHIACTDHPLSFGVESGRPCILSPMSRNEFITWLAGYLHPKGKLIQMNIFRGSYRFHAHLGDVLGSEVGTFGRSGRRKLADVESDAVSNLRRAYAYRRPTANLLQEGNYHKPVPALTRKQIEQYIDHQAFYGFYPGIATTGGEEKPGYRNWKRYFRSTEQFERDRDLFKKYIPVIRRINKAGWEPVTRAKTSDEGVMVERFGSWDRQNLHFTLRNQAEEEKSCVLAMQFGAPGTAPERLGDVRVKDLLSAVALQATPARDTGEMHAPVTLKPKQTAVISVSCGGEQ